MSAVGNDAVTSDARGGLGSQVGLRWRSRDPLLPAPPAELPPGCGAALRVTGPDGEVLAAGSCSHWEGEPDALDMTWGAARRFELTAWVAGPGGADVTGALDSLLGQWREHLAGLPDAGAADTAAVVNWPSRDVDGAVALLRRGFAPLAVIAARVTGADPDQPAAPGPAGGVVPPGVRIRRAGPADVDAVVRRGLEVVRFDAYFGGVQERPSTAEALRREFAAMLAAPRPWIWLAERDSEAVGMLAAEQPEQASWIAPLARPAPVSYLLLMGVRAGERARGIGAALSARLNEEVRAAGVALTLLHYAQVNPLSAPFWSQQGYRPLWTCWETRPPLCVR
ncbi:MAG TPA: GNAT family N-acetyltransferase [Streptosporangiaceae bacterium]|nr:GNAT family N-acetyltransferase [Streptosporangiaceae bacterium]